jgi:hypothetical protein
MHLPYYFIQAPVHQVCNGLIGQLLSGYPTKCGNYPFSPAVAIYITNYGKASSEGNVDLLPYHDRTLIDGAETYHIHVTRLSFSDATRTPDQQLPNCSS